MPIALVAGELFTNLARGAATLSLALYLYRLTGNVWAGALACLAELAVSLLLRRACGSLVDRAGARTVLGAGSALLALLFAPLWLVGDLYAYSVVLALAVALLACSLRTFTAAAGYAAVVLYARGREDATNSALGIAMQAGQFGGMALAGLVLEMGSINLVGLAVGGSYALATLCYLLLPARRAAAPAATTESAAIGLFRLMQDHPVLARCSLLGALDFALVGVFNLLLAPVVAVAFGDAPRWMAILDATFTVGALAGGALLPLAWKHARPHGWSVSLLSCATAGCALLAMVSTSGVLLYASLLLFGLAVNVSYMFWMTAAQTATPPGLGGRVGAMRTVVNGFALALASAVIAALGPLDSGRLLALALTLPSVFLVMALVLAVPAWSAAPPRTSE